MNTNFRKDVRLKNYDYTQNGYYFITVCTDFKKCILSFTDKGVCQRVVAGFHACNMKLLTLTQIGKEVEKTIIYINKNYHGAKVEKYCIMPNHIHMIISISGEGGHGNPPLRDVIGRFKSYSTRIYRELIDNPKIILWQRNYYEHIIRNEEDFLEKWNYIDNNALNWILKQKHINQEENHE